MGIMKLLLIIAIALVCFIGYVRHLESNALFFPSKNVEHSPLDYGFEYEDVYFQTEDALTLNAWWLPQNQKEKTILFIHGNAGNIGDRLEKIAIFHE